MNNELLACPFCCGAAAVANYGSTYSDGIGGWLGVKLAGSGFLAGQWKIRRGSKRSKRGILGLAQSICFDALIDAGHLLPTLTLGKMENE